MYDDAANRVDVDRDNALIAANAHSVTCWLRRDDAFDDTMTAVPRCFLRRRHAAFDDMTAMLRCSDAATVMPYDKSTPFSTRRCDLAEQEKHVLKHKSDFFAGALDLKTMKKPSSLNAEV